MVKHYTVDIEHQRITFNSNVTPDELLEIAKLQAVGYTAVKESSTKGKNKDWYLKKLPDNAARNHFNELCASGEKLDGYRAAVAWAKETYPDIFPVKSKKSK